MPFKRLTKVILVFGVGLIFYELVDSKKKERKKERKKEKKKERDLSLRALSLLSRFFSSEETSGAVI